MQAPSVFREDSRVDPVFLAAASAGGLALVAWLAVLLDPARAWDLRPSPRTSRRRPSPPPGRRVAVLVPARNESASLPATLPALLAQDYPGDWRVVLVDDRSDDGTARGRAGASRAAPDALTVVAGAPLPDGLGRQGLGARAGGRARPRPSADYLLLTDADIRHAPRLAAPPRRRERGGRAGAEQPHGAAALRVAAPSGC